MFLTKKSNFKEFITVLGIIFYAYYINRLSSAVGVMPIDSFGFFDTAFSILKNKLPIRDFWIFTGLIVDYMGAFFLTVFGKNWASYVLHASFMNIVASLSFYIFLNKINFNKIFAIFYTISFATLCYPVSGTPFAYIHAYIFSLISIFFFIIAVKNNNFLSWFLIPIFCFMAFLSMQTPSAYIILIIFFLSIIHFVKHFDFKNVQFFVLGAFLSILIFILFLFFTKTPFINFLYQYILFPLTIGEGRFSSNEMAYLGLIDQLNIKRILGDFKFLHVFLVPLIFVAIRYRKKNKGYLNSFNLIIILSSFAFIFNQLLTANQIYIFSMIPLLAAVLHFNILKIDPSSKLVWLLIFIVLFASIKFHFRYNIDRKFHDLETIDKSKAIDAVAIDKNLKGLKWINKLNLDPLNEIDSIKNALVVIKNDQRKKILITHYQFISTILDEDLNILNRWYLWDNNTHPTENHKYFEFYKSMVQKNVDKNKIQVIYLLGHDNEMMLKNIKNYFTNVCFKSKTLEEKRFSSHELITCK